MIGLAISAPEASRILGDLYCYRYQGYSYQTEPDGQGEDSAKTVLVGVSGGGIGYELHLVCENTTATIKLYTRTELEDHSSLVAHLREIFRRKGRELKVNQGTIEKIPTEEIHAWQIPLTWRPPEFPRQQSEVEKRVKLLFPS